MFQSKEPSPVSLSGIALHSGEKCTITFRPGKEKGIFFVVNGIRIPALAENVTDTVRGTSLKDAHVVEHVLSAVSGLGIGNIEIELTRKEPPAMDGSAEPFARALVRGGFSNIQATPLTINEPIIIKDGESFIEAHPYNGFSVDFTIDFPAIGIQHFIYEDNYLRDIAPARTFGFIEELEALINQGLAKGASLDSALALSNQGYVNTPRFKDEPVRHKILDLIGDLSLVGAPIHAKIIAKKSGHKLNVALAVKLREILIKQGGA